MTTQPLDDQVQVAMQMSEEELLEALGAAHLGSDSVQDAIAVRSMLRLPGGTEKMLPRTFDTSALKAIGESHFAYLWGQAKAFICHVYRSEMKVDGEKSLVAYLVGLVVSALSISEGVAVFLVTLAVKRGLEMLCQTSSTMPVATGS